MAELALGAGGRSRQTMVALPHPSPTGPLRAWVGRAGAATRRTLGDSEGHQGTTNIEVSSGLQPFTWAANPLDWAFTRQRP